MVEQLPKGPAITTEEIEKLLKYQYGDASYFEPQSITNTIEFNVDWKSEHDALAQRLSEVLETNESMLRDLNIYEQAILKIVQVQPLVYDGELAHGYRTIAHKALQEVTEERVRES